MTSLSGRPVLVTGAGGFIGGHLVEMLVGGGASVTALVRYNSRNERGTLDWISPDVASEVKVVLGELRDVESVSRAVQGSEIVLHLGERDRVRLEEFHRALHGQPRTWAGISDAEQAAVNEQHLSPLRALTWDSAVRRLESLREQLLLRLHEVPALPDDVWQRGHAFADMMWGLPEHDRHHAAQIKRARTGEPVLTED